MGERVPMVVLAGWLGSGKTTLLNGLLAGSSEERVAVIVNDVGEINIDVGLIESHDEVLVELTNGCVCCSIGDSLAITLFDLFQRHPVPDRVVVEASGVADPARVAAYGNREVLTIESVVVTVDATDFLTMSRHPTYGGLVCHQVQCADIVVITKSDLVRRDQLESVKAACRALTAAPITTSAPDSAWLVSLIGAGPIPKPPAAEQSALPVATSVVKPDGPVNVEEFGRELLATPGLLRAKGYVTDERTGASVLLNVAGLRLSIDSSVTPHPDGVVLIGESSAAPDDLARPRFAKQAESRGQKDRSERNERR